MLKTFLIHLDYFTNIFQSCGILEFYQVLQSPSQIITNRNLHAPVQVHVEQFHTKLKEGKRRNQYIAIEPKNIMENFDFKTKWKIVTVISTIQFNYEVHDQHKKFRNRKRRQIKPYKRRVIRRFQIFKSASDLTSSCYFLGTLW